jgi:AcrR family transcriptional regulator
VRAAVLDATTETLAAVGYDRLSVEDVATRAGVHKTSVYRWWPTKPQLVLDALHARSDAVIEIRNTGRLASDLLAFLRAVAANVTSPLGHALLVGSIRGGSETPELENLRRTFWTERMARASGRLDEARLAGEIPSDTDSALMIEALVSPIHFRALVSGAPINDRFLKALIRSVVRG